MKVQDLRLGNYVQWIDTKEVQIIYELEHRYKDVYRINDRNNHDNLEPIPLSEKWLIDFGFFCWGKKRNWFDKEYNDRLNISINTKGLIAWGVKSSDNWETQHQIKPIKYVHQLQNLYFALTGKELIKN
jgi:hypothetical protein